MLPGFLRLDHFPADGRRRLFAPAVPGAQRAVDVVEAGDVRFQIDDSRTWYWRNACQSRRLSWAK